MIYVMSPRRDAFDRWCEENGVNPHSRREVMFVPHAQRLRGRNLQPNDRVVWVDHPDWLHRFRQLAEIKQYLRIMDRCGMFT